MCNVYLCVRTEGNGFVIFEDTAAVYLGLEMVYNILGRMGENEFANL